MAGIQLSVKLRNAKLVSKNLEDFTTEVKQVSAGRLWGRLEAARKQLTQAPAYTGKPEHHWPEGEKGERARRWYFANLREGNVNPPHQYVRTGRYAKGWKIATTQDKNGYMLSNPFPAAKWIAGSATNPEMQYHVHRGRWATMREAVETAVDKLPKEVSENIAIVARRRGLA